jgi:4-amino-4-deoxy-L-arabinose transferase-like glycosyltransferase
MHTRFNEVRKAGIIRRSRAPARREDSRITLRRWPLVVLLALAPVWLVGILWRSAWTPDEPREADVAWRMSLQSDRTLPQLADTPFLEKPPLSYWMSAASLDLFGDSPAAARVPNIVYAAATAISIGALAFAMESAIAAVIAALVAGTAVTAFRVTVWLAPDACLLAGNALALLGAYLGFVAPPGRRKLFGYTLMHAGAAVGFMAKSAPGWLVPALALLAVMAWERRWSELRRWELYVGLVAQSLLIGPWLYAVSRTAHGTDALQVLFWNNVIGRFVKISAPAALDYTSGHKNLPGKYFMELPIYLLPWTLLAAAALRRAWDRVRTPGAQGTTWRFAISAIVPFLLLLSVAATARDIYAAPILLGFALLIALWATEPAIGQTGPRLTFLNRLALTGTRLLVTLIGLLLALVMLILALATDRNSSLTFAVTAAAVVAVVIMCERLAAKSQLSGDALQGFAWSYTAYAAALTLAGLAIFPTIDRWQDLPALAQRIRDDSLGRPLALLQPDETTIAMLDHRLQTPFEIVGVDNASPKSAATDTSAVGAVSAVASWFRAHGAKALVLVKLPGRAPGSVTHLLSRVVRSVPPGDGIAATLVSSGVATMLHRYELPEGRRYALLGPPQKPGQAGPSPQPNAPRTSTRRNVDLESYVPEP